jgi:SAM-dependent methyltransferase
MAVHLTEEARYAKDVQTLGSDHPWHRFVKHIPPGSRILDVGCGSGDLGRFLMSRASQVDGIESNSERAALARQHLHTVVTGEAGDATEKELCADYQVIIFSDVLEHIAFPEETLRWAMSRLAEDGRIIALIPNSANWKFRRKVLRGDWSYDDTGYFDRDHLRFYDVHTARDLGRRVGLRELAVEFHPERLPKPLDRWWRGACVAATRRPNLFAGHVLVVWQSGTSRASSPT